MPVTGNMLRAAMRRVPSPVTVVTAADPEVEGPAGLRGMTVGSFTSVALTPPLVSFNVQRDATMHDLLRREGARFAVNVLSEKQAALAVHFAVPERTGAEQFGPAPHRIGARGVPVLGGVLEVLHGRVEQFVEAGDHAVFVGRVTEIERGEEGAPLLYFESEYHGVGYEVGSSEGFSPEALSPAGAPSEAKRASSETPFTPVPKKAKS